MSNLKVFQLTFGILSSIVLICVGIYNNFQYPYAVVGIVGLLSLISLIYIEFRDTAINSDIAKMAIERERIKAKYSKWCD
jgi:hypothetical protein